MTKITIPNSQPSDPVALIDLEGGDWFTVYQDPGYIYILLDDPDEYAEVFELSTHSVCSLDTHELVCPIKNIRITYG